MGKPRQRARRGGAPIVIVATLVVVAAALTALFVLTRPPELPELDVRAELRAIELRTPLPPDNDRLLERLIALERLTNQQGTLEYQAAVSETRDAGPGPSPLPEDDSPADDLADERLLAWWLDTGGPAELRALLDAGVRQRPLAEHAEIRLRSLTRARFRSLVHAEMLRLEAGLHARDAATARDAGLNILGIARLHSALPLDEAFGRSANILRDLDGATIEHLALRRVNAETARALLEVYTHAADGLPDHTADVMRGASLIAYAELRHLRDEGEPLREGAHHADVWAAIQQRRDEWIAYLRVGDPTLQRPGNSAATSPVENGLMDHAPMYRRISNAYFHALWTDATLRSALALEVYRAERGAPPASLDALVDAGILDALPRDPWAPDGALRYGVDNAAPAGYTLYSVGRDGTDDNATNARAWYFDRGAYQQRVDTLLTPGVPAWEGPADR